MSRSCSQVHIRLPAEVKDWIENSARRNERTQNGEFVFHLRRAMEKERASDQPGSNSDASHAE